MSDGESTFEALASYVTDAPEGFITAVARLVLGEPTTRAEFEAEPTAYRWIFQRNGDDVDIRLLELESRRLPDGVGLAVWSSLQTIDALARAVVRAFDAVVTEHGVDGYQAMWGRPFPDIELNALRSAWRTTRRRVRSGRDVDGIESPSSQ